MWQLDKDPVQRIKLFINPDPGGGGGDDPPTHAIFRASPAGPYDFGNIPVAGVGQISVTIYNDGDSTLQISTLVITGAPFSSSFGATPKNIVGHGSYTFNLLFTPPTNGPFAGTVKFTFNASGTPYQKNLSGIGVSPGGTGIIQVVPITVSFGDVKVGTNSTPLQIVITNIGDAPFNVTSGAFDAGTDFFVSVVETGYGAGIMYPKYRRRRSTQWAAVGSSLNHFIHARSVRSKSRTSWQGAMRRITASPLQLPPGDSTLLRITFHPTLVGPRTDVLHIQTSLGGAPYDIAMDGNGVLIFPVAIVDASVRQMLIGFMTAGGVATVRALDPVNLDGAEAAEIWLNNPTWSNPGMEKTLERVEMFYENKGAAQLSIEVSAFQPAPDGSAPDNFQTITATEVFGTAAADDSIRSVFFNIDGGISGEVIKLKIKRNASAGPLSILGFEPHFAPRGEKVAN